MELSRLKTFQANLDMPTNRITAILEGLEAITTDTACQLGIAFGTSEEFWINLQTQYEHETVQRNTMN